MKISGDVAVKAAMVFAVLGALYVVRRDAIAIASEVGTAINPTSQDNLVYRGVNAYLDAVDDANDNDSATLGTTIADAREQIARWLGIETNESQAGQVFYPADGGSS